VNGVSCCQKITWNYQLGHIVYTYTHHRGRALYNNVTGVILGVIVHPSEYEDSKNPYSAPDAIELAI